MNPVEINSKAIAALAWNEEVKQKGDLLFHNGRVMETVLDKVKRKMRGEVLDGESYNVSIHFTALFRIRSYACTCADSYEKSGACRHVVAVLKTLQSKEEIAGEKAEMEQKKAETARVKAEVERTMAESLREKEIQRKKVKEEKIKAKLNNAKLNAIRQVFAQAKAEEEADAVINNNTETNAKIENINEVLAQHIKPKTTVPQNITMPIKQRSQAAEELLNFFTSQAPEPYELLNVEYLLHVTTGYADRADLSLKIGVQRLYQVKDLGELISSIKNSVSLEFGKQFVYEPYRHTFREHDRPVLDFLLDMYEQHRAWISLNYSPYSFSNAHGFPKKNLIFHGIYLEKFLDALGENSFSLALDTQPARNTRIHRTGLSLEYNIEPSGLDIALKLGSEHLPRQLTQNGKYFLDQNDIYLATPQQQQLLPHILKAFRKEKSKTLILPSDKRDAFVSEALPMIKKTGKLAVDEALAQKFSHENLVTKIFFERNLNEGITARVEFHYGAMLINPFAPQEAKAHPNTAEDIIIVRNSEEERKILNILERAEFTTTQGKIHLDEEDQLFELVQTYIPMLQEIAELYYAEDLKVTIKKSLSFAGKVRLDEKLDLLEVSFQYNELSKEEVSDLFRALSVKKKYHRLKDGSFLDLNQPDLNNIFDLITNLGLKAEQVGEDAIALPKYRALYLENFLRQTKVPGIQRSLAYKHLIQSILEPQDAEFEVPLQLQTIMRDYQKTGFKWLKTLSSYGLGGILADDMGLGKTLQVLSFILSEKAPDRQPALVIAPTSLVYNWQEEARKFVPEIQVLVVDGTPATRQSLLEGAGGYDLVVTSYPLLRRDAEYYAELNFEYCFLDEAQHIKNPQTINAKTVQGIRAKAYFALTGTPIENSLSELWSIFNFVMPGYLLTHTDFRRKYEIPIVKGDDPKPMLELSRHVTPFILRRLKKDVLLELPDKIETRLTAQMTPEQTRIYLAYWQEAKKNIAQEISNVGFEKSHIKILAALTRLRQICSHPAMFIEDYQGESGKMQLFQEVLEDALDSGHRILVFSQFTTMLDIIQEHLKQQKIEHFYLNGSTPAATRLDMVQDFNSGTGKVFLISLKAGGTGLNLTGADMVIHFDPWWNPAVEDQATDRAHRIGQSNTVQVIRLLTQGTIEEKVFALQEKKKQMIQNVIHPGETLLTKLSQEELFELFN